MYWLEPTDFWLFTGQWGPDQVLDRTPVLRARTLPPASRGSVPDTSPDCIQLHHSAGLSRCGPEAQGLCGTDCVQTGDHSGVNQWELRIQRRDWPPKAKVAVVFLYLLMSKISTKMDIVFPFTYLLNLFIYGRRNTHSIVIVTKTSYLMSCICDVALENRAVQNSIIYFSKCLFILTYTLRAQLCRWVIPLILGECMVLVQTWPPRLLSWEQETYSSHNSDHSMWCQWCYVVYLS